MPRRLISLRLDPTLLDAARRQARRERRSVANLIEVALAAYLDPKGAPAMIYVYWHQDGHAPQRVRAFASEEEARAYLRAHTIDEHGNVSEEPDSPYLYLADSQGRPLDDDDSSRDSL